MSANKVVAHLIDGRIVRGTTSDFVPARDTLHITESEAPPDGKPLEVRLPEVKALFFVKDLAGDSSRVDKVDFDLARPALGRRIRVEFTDGEVLLGTTQGYRPDRPGFFLAPVDPESNIDHCYVVAAAARQVTFLQNVRGVVGGASRREGSPLGHSTIAITMDLSSHLLSGMQEAAAAQMDAILSPVTEASES